MSITANEAQRLVNTLRISLEMSEETLQRIVETKAWEALGYESFRAMWDSEIGGNIELTALTRAVIVYEMIDEASPEIEQADKLLDTSSNFIEAIKQAHKIGFTAPQAAIHGETIVRQHTRRPRGTANSVSIGKLEPTELLRWKEFAKSRKVKTSEMFRDALRIGMDQKMREAFANV